MSGSRQRAGLTDDVTLRPAARLLSRMPQAVLDRATILGGVAVQHWVDSGTHPTVKDIDLAVALWFRSLTIEGLFNKLDLPGIRLVDIPVLVAAILDTPSWLTAKELSDTKYFAFTQMTVDIPNEPQLDIVGLEVLVAGQLDDRFLAKVDIDGGKVVLVATPGALIYQRAVDQRWTKSTKIGVPNGRQKNVRELIDAAALLLRTDRATLVNQTRLCNRAAFEAKAARGETLPLIDFQIYRELATALRDPLLRSEMKSIAAANYPGAVALVTDDSLNEAAAVADNLQTVRRPVLIGFNREHFLTPGGADRE